MSIIFINDAIIDGGAISGLDTYVSAAEESFLEINLILWGIFMADPARPILFRIRPDCVLTEDGTIHQGTNWTDRFCFVGVVIEN